MININRVSIADIQRAQMENMRMVAALQPGGIPGRAAQFMAAAAHRYAVAITHVDTGTWRAAHRIEEDFGAGRAAVFVSPNAINPRSGTRAIEYATQWEQRGGEMAVYKRTAAERGEAILRDAGRLVLKELLHGR